MPKRKKADVRSRKRSTGAEEADNDRRSQRPRAFESGTAPADALNTLLRERYAGAVNVRGIRFQVRYAALRCLMAAQAVRDGGSEQGRPAEGLVLPGDASGGGLSPLQVPLVRMEGIEDVDISDPSVGPLWVLGDPTHPSGEYVQVKTAATPWNWAKLKGPLLGWIELQRTGAAGITFVLVVNFALRGDLAALASFRDLDPNGQRNIRKKFRKLAAALSASEAEADEILDQLTIEYITDEELRSRMRSEVSKTFDLIDSAAADAFELAYTGRVLEWSEYRSTVCAADVLALGQSLGEGLARQAGFRAIAQGLVGKIDFSADATPDDFFKGRRTRIGHVAGGLDVRRPEWLGRIDQAVGRAGVCVIRAPSGHGKSALAFRYVMEQWPASQVILVRSAQTTDEVVALADLLRHRREIGLPVRVLIEADYRTRLWPEVAAAAAAVGALVLVTVRAEDYQRFPLNALTRREIIEPTLSLEEASAIFDELSARGLVASSVSSPAWAYEKLRRPALLLEYVYLLTQGAMLEDRLRDQVHAFGELDEDPGKRDVLRLVSLASALGAAVRLESLLDAVTLQDDPQAVLQSLLGEYILVEGGLVHGLHWVRSEHLGRLLHENGIPPVHQTALRILRLVPETSLPFVIANTLSWDGINRSFYLAGLTERYQDADTDSVVSVVEGLFEAGERLFLAANREPFDEAHNRLGSSGLMLLWTETAPILRVGTVERLMEIMGEGTGALPLYRTWIEQVQDGPRGLDSAREFLQAAAPFRTADNLNPSGSTGRLLDWCALAGVQLPYWKNAQNAIAEHPGPCALGFDEALDLLQGLYRYDREIFEKWYDTHGATWAARVQRRVTGLSLTFPTPSSVEIVELARATNAAWISGPEANRLDEAARRQAVEDASAALADAERHGVPTADVEVLFAMPADASGSGEQVRWRLDALRRAFPFAGRYYTQGDYLIPDEIVLPVDDTSKAVPRWNLPLPSDVEKNRVWGDVVGRAFLPDSFYRFQERWAAARRSTLRMVNGLNRLITHAMQGNPIAVDVALGPTGDPVTEMDVALREAPWLTAEQFFTFGQPLSPALTTHLEAAAPDRWRSDTQTFLQQLLTYLSASDERIGRLAVVNFRNAASALQGMHAFFEAMFLDSPDYFDVRSLNTDERSAYDDLAVLLAGRITDPVRYVMRRPVAELRAREAARLARDVARIAEAVDRLTKTGRTVLPPLEIVPTGGLKATLIGVEVRRLNEPMADLLPVLEALQSVSDLVDWFYFVPIRDGQLLDDAAYSVSARLLGIDMEQWDERDLSSVALSLHMRQPVPAELMHLMPDLPRAVEAAGPSFVQRCVGLCQAAALFARRSRQIDVVGGPEPLPDLMSLRAELRRDLSEIADEVRGLAVALRAEVHDKLDSQRANAAAAGAELRTMADDAFSLVTAEPGDPTPTWKWAVDQVEHAALTFDELRVSDHD